MSRETGRMIRRESIEGESIEEGEYSGRRVLRMEGIEQREWEND